MELRWLPTGQSAGHAWRQRRRRRVGSQSCCRIIRGLAAVRSGTPSVWTPSPAWQPSSRTCVSPDTIVVAEPTRKPSGSVFAMPNRRQSSICRPTAALLSHYRQRPRPMSPRHGENPPWRAACSGCGMRSWGGWWLRCSRIAAARWTARRATTIQICRPATPMWRSICGCGVCWRWTRWSIWAPMARWNGCPASRWHCPRPAPRLPWPAGCR